MVYYILGMSDGRDYQLTRTLTGWFLTELRYKANYKVESQIRGVTVKDTIVATWIGGGVPKQQEKKLIKLRVLAIKSSNLSK